MKVSVAYATRKKHVWFELEVDPSATVQQVIEQSGILQRFPDIDLEEQKVGVFGKLVKLTAPVEEGSRVEIYRPITVDPETVERNDR